jgi:Metallo-beta-lactamase superfamily
MIFSLEALRARHGDSLLLHYGSKRDPKLIVVDGGPSGVFKAALMPRLEALRDERGGELAIEILMVSHLDDDHVRGILDFSRALDDDEALQGDFRVRTLWLNAFEDAVGDGAPIASGSGAVPAGLDDGRLTAVVANVGEGRSLRDTAEKLGWKSNKGFDGLVAVPDDKGVAIDLDPLRLTVVGPRTEEIEELREEWAKEVKKLEKAEPSEVGRVAEYLDESVYNLSSIVCLAEMGKKRMLLTGDARGDKILLGLEAAGLLEPKKSMGVDLLKVPHHGSSRNLEREFFERVRARDLVISADGEYHNPDLETLEMISAARPDDDFTIHLTYSDFKLGMGPKIHGFFEAEAKGGRKYGVAFRPDDDLSLRVDLLDPPE